MSKTNFKHFGSSSYKQLRASGMPHSEAFSKVGTMLQSKMFNLKHTRVETKLIKPINGFNKTAVNKFAEKFGRGTIEKDEFLASKNNEPLSYADEIGGLKRKIDPEKIAKEESIERKRLMGTLGGEKISYRRRMMSVIDSLLVTGQYKQERGKIKIGGFVIGEKKID